MKECKEMLSEREKTVSSGEMRVIRYANVSLVLRTASMAVCELTNCCIDSMRGTPFTINPEPAEDV